MKRLSIAVIAVLGWSALVLPARGAARPLSLLCLTTNGMATTSKVRPHRCAHFGPGGSFGGGVNLVSLHWSHWGSSITSGTGIERGFHLPFSNIAVSVSAYRRRNGCRVHGRRLRVYTRLRATSAR
ncbi:MAG: hypothetical protein M3Z33_08305 [Actinomycetota bacterium]|nr:hypothetical protein [Actinomycetota bacterium]